MSRTDPHRRTRAGFSLVEVMIAGTISTVILAAVLTVFLMLGRNGYNAASYSMMETQSRQALELFCEDARMASNISWSSNQNITLTVVKSGGTVPVVYYYDSAGKTFNRQAGGQTRILVRDVAEFSYRRYKIVNGVEYTAGNDLETKQIQITLRAIRGRATVVDATNAVLSARVVLRNKQVTT